jgi:uncharacterized membrane protein/predicted DsbA family dithiol-disulfide isomerase
MSEAPTEKTVLRIRIILIIALIVQIAGLIVGAELTEIHYFTHTDPSYQSVCAVNETINCETVAQSPYSVFLGMPVSVFGIFGYLLMACLTVWGLSKRRLHPHWPLGALFGTFIVSAASSLTLGYISFVRIDSLCIFCMTLYGLNTILLILGIILLATARTGPIKALARDLKALFSRPAILLALVVIFGGLFAAPYLLIEPYWQHPGWSDLPELPTGKSETGCHWIGAENPLVTVVEFSDYQCPHCRQAHKRMRFQAAKYPNEVRLIHSHLPLDNACNDQIKRQFHARACEFSKAAECAAEQGMFWPMNDALFSIQDDMNAGDINLDRLAVQLGLDRSIFNQCMAAEGIPECIQKDIEESRRRGVAGTPTFFIQSQPYEGGIPDQVLETVVEKARKKRK